MDDAGALPSNYKRVGNGRAAVGTIDGNATGDALASPDRLRLLSLLPMPAVWLALVIVDWASYRWTVA
jgi:hypothetical protein